jgi:hypothetical protein
VIKSRRLRWAGNEVLMGKSRDADRVLVGNLREGGHLENSGVHGRIILKWILEKCDGGIDWLDLAQDSDR